MMGIVRREGATHRVGGGGSTVGSVSVPSLTLEPADAVAVLKTIRRPGSVTALTGRVGNGAPPGAPEVDTAELIAVSQALDVIGEDV